ncbi:uncharacterized protein mRpS34 [Fopius arisanus]|uniref:MRPS34 protein n=1 Tax=Fopius arisanus TaxID=64838 RepID=A0A0C9QZQ5_9HYME|nr:PREDICTED: uncharacterized protein LOC105267553 [Fopius arisanus]
MPVQLIGRTTDFCGKTLWELVGNLKNHGKDRIVIRQRFQRYPEPCFIKILKVGALPPEVFTSPKHAPIHSRKCMALVETTFRGKKDSRISQMDRSTYKTDFRLVPKDEEHKYLNWIDRPEVILPRTMELPPLLREIMVRNLRAKGQKVDTPPQMTIQYNKTGIKIYRVAEEGETPTIVPTISLGPPASPQLYTNVKPI